MPSSDSTPSAPIADSVRLALAGEAETIAGIQRRAWSSQFAPDTAETLLSGIDAEQMVEAWRLAITRPPEARYRVMVAVAQDRLAGFATTIPSSDSDADPARDGLIDEFAIDPVAQRIGHGSRLLNACIDTLRADGFTRATFWVNTGNDILRTFLTGAGWEADGAHRELGTDDDLRIKQVRLHTDITD